MPPQQGMDMGAGVQKFDNNMGGYQEALPGETSGSGDHHDSPRRDAKGRRRNQTKTERQQMLNKAAQQRCGVQRLCQCQCQSQEPVVVLWCCVSAGPQLMGTH